MTRWTTGPMNDNFAKTKLCRENKQLLEKRIVSSEERQSAPKG